MGKAFIFPGQGSQHVGMGKDLYENFSSVRNLFEEAEDALHIKLKKICFDGPEADLRLTQHTQPAILTMSVAVAQVVKAEAGIVPFLVVGHSLGEYSALVTAGALQFSDAVVIVYERGKAMQSAVPVGKGAMAAFLGGERSQVEALCQEVTDSFKGTDEFMSPANFNGGGQIVVSGTAAAVKKGIESAKEKGIRKARLLPVSAPFHCRLMEPAAKRVADLLEKIVIQKPAVPYIANVDATLYDSEVGIKDRLVRQIPNPVLWEDSMKRLSEHGISAVYECGPGKVLTGLLRRINTDIQTINIEKTEDLKGLK